MVVGLFHDACSTALVR